MKLINIGYGNMVNADRVVAVVSPESAPVKRMIQEAKAAGTIIDATHGRKTMSVIITDSDHIILTYFPGEKVADRIHDTETGNEEDEDGR
ncbi:MAG: DUF370 domain-containing protein [Clostridia bacterium]|nr:DUF370 domain-containing protein [Clostridia bacterium]MBR6361156.1 DUF370 domain-containing protein [Clostridia bacterium]